MKIFTTDEVINYMIETFGGWTDDQIKKTVNRPETASRKATKQKLYPLLLTFFNED